jgi:hypothetical protein
MGTSNKEEKPNNQQWRDLLRGDMSILLFGAPLVVLGFLASWWLNLFFLAQKCEQVVVAFSPHCLAQ